MAFPIPSESISLAKARLPDMGFTRTYMNTLLHRVQNGLSSVELVFFPHDKWPLPHLRFSPPTHRPPRILVLDSSYNPPTLAHLALANSHRPSYSVHSDSNFRDDITECDYDARLLLLSIRNADKMLKPGDASYLQRLEMMTLLTKHIAHPDTIHPNPPHDNVNLPEERTNVAVAIIDEPTFVGKSRKLRTFLRDRLTHLTSTTPHNLPNDPQLSFLLGFDTLERLVSPRYYPSEAEMLSALRTFFAPDGDDSRIVCARRPMSTELAGSNESQETLGPIQEFISSRRIVLIDIEEDVRTFSSSAVRNTIMQLGLGSEEWKKFVPGDIADYIVKERLFSTRQ